MKVQPIGTRVFKRPPTSVDSHFHRINSPVHFPMPELVAEAGVAHWFSRGWRRSARDLNDFVDPNWSDFQK